MDFLHEPACFGCFLFFNLTGRLSRLGKGLCLGIKADGEELEMPMLPSLMMGV